MKSILDSPVDDKELQQKPQQTRQVQNVPPHKLSNTPYKKEHITFAPETEVGIAAVVQHQSHQIWMSEKRAQEHFVRGYSSRADCPWVVDIYAMVDEHVECIGV